MEQPITATDLARLVAGARTYRLGHKLEPTTPVVMANRGGPQDPLSDDEVRQKLLLNAGQALTEERSKALASAIFEMDRAPAVGHQVAGTAGSHHIRTGGTMPQLNVGDTAPDITLPIHGKETFTLSEAIKKGPVVLLAYIFDFTGG